MTERRIVHRAVRRDRDRAMSGQIDSDPDPVGNRPGLAAGADVVPGLPRTPETRRRAK